MIAASRLNRPIFNVSSAMALIGSSARAAAITPSMSFLPAIPTAPPRLCLLLVKFNRSPQGEAEKISQGPKTVATNRTGAGGFTDSILGYGSDRPARSSRGARRAAGPGPARRRGRFGELAAYRLRGAERFAQDLLVMAILHVGEDASARRDHRRAVGSGVAQVRLNLADEDGAGEAGGEKD